MPIIPIQELAKIAPSPFPLLGLDVGSKTIGISLSDRLGIIASPLLTIKRTKFSQDMLTIQNLVKEHKIQGFVVGLPLNMEGTRSARTQSTQQFAQNLLAYIDLPVVMVDERLSTSAVTNVMLDADLSRKRRAVLVDKLAATYILQMALDLMRNTTIKNS